MKGLDGIQLMNLVSEYQVYVALHVVSLLICLTIFMIVLWSRPSRGQSATMLVVSSGCIYTFGFLAEITSKNVDGYFTATLTQYFGECILMIGFTFMVSEMCHKTIPKFIYGLECMLGVFIMWLLFTTKENHFYYTYIGVNTDGPFPRVELEYGWGFYLFFAYSALVSIYCFVICILEIIKTNGIERKRIIFTAISIACPWIHNLIRATGITGGYEIPCIGFTGAIILVGIALLRYGYFDSITLAGENALGHGQEGIMVIDNHHTITYFNNRMEEMFGKLALKQNAYENELLKQAFEGTRKTLERKDKFYEMRVEPLEEGGYIQGYMLWMLDITAHHQMLIQISELAHKDSLTGVYNRRYFVELLEEYLQKGDSGSLFMMDLKNLKQVNDRYGHQVGDEVLEKFGHVLLTQGDKTISCRIGGDEFCLFCKEVIDAKALETLVLKISMEFTNYIAEEKYAGVVDIAFGISRILEPSDRVFKNLYSNADKALYVAKNRSKNAWYIL